MPSSKRSDDEIFADMIEGEEPADVDLSGIDMIPMIRAKLAWDMLPCNVVGLVWPKLDLEPPTEEGAEVMHQDSHARLNLTLPVHAALEMYAVLCADMITRVSLARFEEANPEASPEQAAHMRFMMNQQYIDVCRSALFPTLAQMLEDGFLTYGPRVDLTGAEEVQQ